MALVEHPKNGCLCMWYNTIIGLMKKREIDIVYFFLDF